MRVSCGSLSRHVWGRKEKPLLAFQPEVDALSVAPQMFSLCGGWGWGEVRIAWYYLINMFVTSQYTSHHMLLCLSLFCDQLEFEHAQKSLLRADHHPFGTWPEKWPRSSFVRQWLQRPLLLLQLDTCGLYLNLSDRFFEPQQCSIYCGRH